MSEWARIHLGDGLRVRHGFAFKGEFFSPEGRQIVLTPGNFVERGGFKPKNGTEKYYRGPVPERFILKEGDVVIAMTEQADGLLGSSATIPEDDVYLHNQRIGLLEITDAELLDLRYVYHLMNSPEVRRQIQATATGSKVRHTAPERVHSVVAPVPLLKEQRLVASVLDAIDDLIRNNRRRVEVLEEMARAIYREWFVKFRYPGHKDVPLVDSALGLIPGGWTIHPFAEIAKFVNGFAFKPSHWGSEGRPIIKIKELKQGVVAGTPRHPAESIAEKYWVERGDLLFSWSADLGVYLWNDEPGLLNQHLFTVRPAHPSLTIPFLFHALDRAMPQFRSRAQGTTMRHIKRSALSEVQTSIPGEELLERFTQTVEPMHEESARLRREGTLLETLRDLLLPKLVTGQVDVSTLALDASVSTCSTGEGAVA